MKWFRSNIRIVSQVALFALAIQFVMSFGHFHAGEAQAAPAIAPQSGFHGPAVHGPGFHRATGFAARHFNAPDVVSHPNAPVAIRLKTAPDREPAGAPADDCAICAVMALAGVIMVATPPDLLAPLPVALLYATADTGFVDLNSARVAFQPRAPPVG